MPAMKVLQVISSLGAGGAEKFVIQLVPALRELGVDARLLVLDRHRSIFHEELEAAGVHDTRSLGLEYYYNPWAMKRLLPELRRFDVIHPHLFPTQYWVAAAAAVSAAGTPLVTTEHNTSNRRRSIKLFHWLDRQAYKRYRAVVTVSEEAQRQLSGYVNAHRTRLLTISNGIDLQRFENVVPADLHSLPDHDDADCHVLQVSTLTPQKDHATLIRAIAACPPHLKLLLAGDGPLKSQLQALTSELGISHRVHFLGVRGDIPALLKAADVAVMSSNYEGLSLSVLEAFAAGTAFIGTDAPGLGKIAGSGGLTVPPADATALASVLTRLANDRQERQQVARRGLEVAKLHSIRHCAQQYLELYEQIRQLTPGTGITKDVMPH